MSGDMFSIKVLCRVKPENEPRQVIFYAKDQEAICVDNTFYNFDKIFRETSTQSDVFNSISSTIDDVMNGFNCTIFAYGQSSSGKTHTLMGYNKDYGILPRLIERLFNVIYETSEDIEFNITMSFLEIYMERIKDLLNPIEDNLKLREGGYKKGFWVQGVIEQKVSTLEQSMLIFKNGNVNRSVSETKLNDLSSRSHSLFIINIEQTKVTTGDKKYSKLTVVDLAGSEKVSKTNATGVTLLEAQYTNKSLTTLGIVIKSLSEKSQHIPYRDSKLTRLLSDSLGGNSKTYLIITCSSLQLNIPETVSTLKFGVRVKTIKNKVKPNIESSVNEYIKIISEYKDTINVLSKPNDDTMLVLQHEYENRISKYKEEIKALQTTIIKLQNQINDNNDEYTQNLIDRDNKIDELTENLKIKELSHSIKIPSNISDTHLKRLLENKVETISILETSLHLSNETNRKQKLYYENALRILKEQNDDLNRMIYEKNTFVLKPIKRKYSPSKN